MIDLSTQTIKELFEEQIRQLTRRTITKHDDLFDYQLSGVWIK